MSDIIGLLIALIIVLLLIVGRLSFLSSAMNSLKKINEELMVQISVLRAESNNASTVSNTMLRTFLQLPESPSDMHPIEVTGRSLRSLEQVFLSAKAFNVLQKYYGSPLAHALMGRQNLPVSSQEFQSFLLSIEKMEKPPIFLPTIRVSNFGENTSKVVPVLFVPGHGFEARNS